MVEESAKLEIVLEVLDELVEDFLLQEDLLEEVCS
jgi:hypothetical protein